MQVLARCNASLSVPRRPEVQRVGENTLSACRSFIFVLAVRPDISRSMFDFEQASEYRRHRARQQGPSPEGWLAYFPAPPVNADCVGPLQHRLAYARREMGLWSKFHYVATAVARTPDIGVKFNTGRYVGSA